MISEQDINYLYYAAGAIAFLIFFWQLTSAQHRRLYPAVLPIAALITAVRMAVIIANGPLPLSPLVLFGCDLLFYASWYTAIFGMVHKLSGARLPHWIAALSLCVVLVICGLTVAGYVQDQPIRRIYASNLIIWANLVLAVFGIVLIEQLYRNVSATARHAIKFFSLGVASLFVYELYLFSQVLVFQGIPGAGWNARGAIYGVAGVFLIVTLSKTDDVPQVALSRHLVFYTTSLVGAGALLFLMSTVGYYVKLYGQSWGAALQQVITFSAILGLILISMVPRWRASTLVFINKHFFTHRYDYRAEWLKLIHLLSLPIDEGDLHQRAIKAMLGTFNSPGGTLWLRSHSRFEPVASCGMDLPADAREPDDSDFIQLMTSREWIFDAREKRYPGDRALPQWADSIDELWIIVPLLNEDKLLGFMGLIHGPGVSSLTWEDLDLLKTVGRQLASYIARHQAAEMLAQSRQFDAYNKLTAFIMHDLKNLIAQQALVVANAAKHKENPAFIDDMITTIENSVQRMNNLLLRMQRKEPALGKLLEVDALLVETITKCGDLKPIPALRLNDKGLRIRADRDSLMMIISHLIRNAQEATPEQGFIDVRLTKRQDRAIIEIEDNGAGMSDVFLKNRLFKPFETTKSDKGMGIGVFQAQEYLRNLGGDIEVESKLGVGTTFFLYLPLFTQEQAAA